MPIADTEDLTELQLDKELRLLNAVLLPSKTQPLERDEWSRRRAALKRLTSLAERHALSDPQRQHLVSRWLRRAMVVQLEDPRSTIVIAACGFVEAFARGTPVGAHVSGAVVCSWWIASVIKCTTSTTQVVVSAAQRVLDALTRLDLWNYESTRALLEACESKHGRTRRHALTTLTHRLQRVQGTSQQEDFAAFLGPLRRVLHSALEDADSEVRQASRTTVVAFEAVFPEEASRVQAGLHPVSRAAMERSRTSGAEALQLLSPLQLPDETQADKADAKRSSLRDSPSPLSGSVFDVAQRFSRTLDDDLLEVAAEKARRARYVPPTHPQTPPATSREQRVSSSLAAASSASTGSPGKARGGGTHSTGSASRLSSHPQLLREHLQSRDWAAREAVLRQLSSELQSERKTEATTSCDKDVEALMELVMPAVSDANLRVAARAQEVVRMLCVAHPRLVQPHLQHLCDVLLRFAANHRHTSRHAAVLLLDTLVQSTDGGLLAAAVAHTLASEPTPAVRLRGIALLAHTVSLKPSQLDAAGVVPVVLRCLAAELQHESGHRTRSHIWSAAVDAVAALYDTLSSSFAEACGQLTGSDLQLVSEALRVSHPELDGTEGDSEGSRQRVTTAAPHRSCGTEADVAAHPETAFRVLVAEAVADQDAAASSPSQALLPEDSNAPHLRPPRSPQQRQQRSRVSSPSHPRRPFALPSHRATEPCVIASPDFTDVPARVQTLLYSLCASHTSWVDGLHLDDHGLGDVIHDDVTEAGITSSLDQSVDAIARSLAHAGGPGGCGIGAPHTTCSALDSLATCLQHGVFTAQELNERGPDVLVVLAPLCMEASEPHHNTRRRAFTCLRRLLMRRGGVVGADCTGSASPLRCFPWLPAKLTALIRLCRAGLDDAFTEVQQEAAILLSLVLHSGGLSMDQRLNALAEWLTKWLRGRHAADATRGRLALLREIGTLLERHQSYTAGSQPPATAPPDQRHASTLSNASLSRICDVLIECTTHCSVEVRRIAMLTFAAMWASLGERSFPFLTPLGQAERKLVTVLYNQAVQQVRQQLPATLAGFTLSTAVASPPTRTGWRDLDDELKAYQARQGMQQQGPATAA